MHLYPKFVGLPDKFHRRTSDRLPMPSRIQGIPPDTIVLGAYATPYFNTLKLLFLVLFTLIFTASKA